jgi:hypothetical protein
MARSILRCWSLRKGNQIIKQRRGNVGIYLKNMMKILLFYFENEFLPKQASGNWTLNVLSGLWTNNI